MKAEAFLAGLALAARAARGLNILITNDDGFGTANIRALYHAMAALGHNCYIVAPSSDRSGQGSRLDFAARATLTSDTEFGIVRAGAPSLGTDPHDDHIWYYDGSPAAQVLVALDYVLPTHANFSVPDLVLAGPNYGLNIGPFLYGISGTLGATQTAVARGIPAMAFAGAYGQHTAYYAVRTATGAGLQDPATITGRLAANLAQAFVRAAASANASRILPLGYGVSVNLPLITSDTDARCVNPPFVRARMTGGGAFTSRAVYDRATGLFGAANVADAGTNMCVNGDCSLPGEVEVVVHGGCRSSVVLFTIDYDAPAAYDAGRRSSAALLPGLVQPSNASSLVGGLGANASVQGTAGAANCTAASTGSTASSPAARAVGVAFVAALLL